MMRFKNLVLAAGMSVASCLSVAEGYVGLGATTMELDIGEFGKYDMAAMYAVVGNQMNENVALEFRLGTGFSDGESYVYGEEVTTEIDDFMGVYMKLGSRVSEDFYPYAIVGFNRIKATVSVQQYSDSTSENDTAFGIGAKFGSASDMNFSVEYLRYYNESDVEINGISLNAVWPL